MRTSPASSPTPHGRGLALTAVVALLLALAAVPALAQGAGGGDDPDADTDGVCTPELVTHSPDGSTGVEVAVAITSQAIDKGVDGWISVSWQVADGAQLTGLTVTEIDGSVSTLTADIDSGSLFDVDELRFCGSYDGEVSVQPEPPVVDDGETTDDGAGSDGAGSDGGGSVDGAKDDGGTATGGGTAGSTGGGTDGSTGGSGNDGSGSAGGSDDTAGSASTDSADDGTDGGSGSGDDPEVVSVPAPEDELDLGAEATLESTEIDGSAPDGGDAASDDVAEEETEVLGVQLTRDDPEPGGAPAWLIIAGVALLGLVGYGAFRLRHAIH